MLIDQVEQHVCAQGDKQSSKDAIRDLAKAGIDKQVKQENEALKRDQNLQYGNNKLHARISLPIVPKKGLHLILHN